MFACTTFLRFHESLVEALELRPQLGDGVREASDAGALEGRVRHHVLRVAGCVDQCSGQARTGIVPAVGDPLVVAVRAVRPALVVAELGRHGPPWADARPDRHGAGDRLEVQEAEAPVATRRLALDDLLVVAPCNAQVDRIRSRLAEGGFPDARVGTVDKFQGQEAPVAIYSLASSSAEDAPRGMGFLYALDRLNVATSRALCATFVVASPALLTPRCATPDQMVMANAFVRYGDMAGDRRRSASRDRSSVPSSTPLTEPPRTQSGGDRLCGFTGTLFGPGLG
jgi:hypothetical protein